MNELFKVNTDSERITISARDLHTELKVKTDFSHWFKRMCEYGFEEETDFVPILGESTGGRPATDYQITIDMAKIICMKQKRNPKSAECLKELMKIDGKTVDIKMAQRDEIEFGKMLDVITGFRWEKQHPIDGGKYRLDFYLEGVLIVEYDEEQHKYSLEKDDERIKYCRDWLASQCKDGDDGWRCPVIRVKKGQELEGLNRIIRHLAGFECFDTQWDYKLQVCDYGNR